MTLRSNIEIVRFFVKIARQEEANLPDRQRAILNINKMNWSVIPIEEAEKDQILKDVVKISEEIGKARENEHYKARFRIFTRDNFTCQYCGAKAPEVKLHLDHIHPKSKGGKDEEDNYITACQECNLGKSAMWNEGLEAFKTQFIEIKGEEKCQKG